MIKFSEMISWISDHWYVTVIAFVILLLIFRQQKEWTGGRGLVVGITGFMGSGKSIFAVSLAHKLMLQGANIYTNFSMNFPKLHENDCPPKCSQKRKCVCVGKKWIKSSRGIRYRQRCLCQQEKNWHRFVGWSQLIELENAVVIIDEAHIMAPSYDFYAIPKAASIKMSLARKYKLNIYWISQNINKVSRVLKTDTNMIWKCRSWLAGFGRGGPETPLILTGSAWEPENFGNRNKKPMQRRFKFWKTEVAELYDSMELLGADSVHTSDESVIKALEINALHNQERLARNERLQCGEITKDGFPCKHRAPCPIPRHREMAKQRKGEKHEQEVG